MVGLMVEVLAFLWARSRWRLRCVCMSTYGGIRSVRFLQSCRQLHSGFLKQEERSEMGAAKRGSPWATAAASVSTGTVTSRWSSDSQDGRASVGP